MKCRYLSICVFIKTSKGKGVDINNRQVIIFFSKFSLIFYLGQKLRNIYLEIRLLSEIVFCKRQSKNFIFVKYCTIILFAWSRIGDVSYYCNYSVKMKKHVFMEHFWNNFLCNNNIFGVLFGKLYLISSQIYLKSGCIMYIYFWN